MSLAPFAWGSALACMSLAFAPAACGIRQLEDELGLVGGGGGIEAPSNADGAAAEAAANAPDATPVDQDASDASSDASNATGAVFVDANIQLKTVGTPYQCPGITAFTITPAAVAPGQAALLEVAVTGPPANVHWSAEPAEAGRFSDESSFNPTFGCGRAGAVTVTVIAELADGRSCSGVRFTSFTGTIDCLPQ